MTEFDVADEKSKGLKEAQKRIKQAAKDSAPMLNLQNLWLSNFPEEVLELKKLQVLDLYANHIQKIPEEIGCLKNLQVLDVGMNYIKALPLGIYQLLKLRKLNVAKIGYDGGISKLPEEIENFQKLTHLDLSGHMLSRLPPQFKSLKNLRSLRLSNNWLGHFPEELLYLENLTQLYLESCSIKEIPFEIGQLRKLEELDLSNPDPKYISISPGSNEIIRIPESLTDLKHLKYLNLSHNPLPLDQNLLSKFREPKKILEVYFKDVALRIQPQSHSNIFINYSRLDQDAAEEIYKILREAGYSPWMDVHNIKGGEIWIHAIEKAINECGLFISILSENSVSRRGVLQKELKSALDKWDEMLPDDIYLIPIRLDNCSIPDRLKSFHVLDWENGKGKGKLLEAIRVGLQRRKD